MNWTIRKKMLGTFGFVIILLLIQLFINGNMLDNSKHLLKQSRDRGYAGAGLAAKITLNVVQVQQWLTDISATRSAPGFDDGFDEAKKNAVLFRENLARLIELYPDKKENLQKIGKSFDAFYEKGIWMAKQYIEGGPESGNKAMEQFDAFAEDIGNFMDGLNTEMNEGAEVSIQKALDEIASSRSIGMTFTLVVVVLTLTISVVFSGKLSNSINKCVTAAQAIAIGDLSSSVEIKSHDETGLLAQSFEEMSSSLKSSAKAAEQISKGNFDVEIKAASDKDVLSLAMIEMRNKLKDNKLKNQKAEMLANKVIAFQNVEVGKLQESLDKLAQGDLNISLQVAPGDGDTAQIRSMFEIISKATNRVVKTMRELIAEISGLIEPAKNGQLEKRGNVAKFQGGYRALVDGLNEILEAVIRPSEEARACLSEMAQGNLTVGMKGQYKGDHAKMKEALNNTLSTLNELLEQITIGADQVSDGAVQVSDSSQSISQGATEQASALEETTASITEINQQTRKNAQNSVEANKLANKSKSSAEVGNTHMQQMLVAMNEINNSSNQISKIIKVIDEIAFQTNLLALNAAVEAARAGVHGKGFAVVAEEVRNLAQRSAKAANETTELIEGSVLKVQNGTKIANQTAEALNEIIGEISKVSVLVDEIATASEEQVEGIEQTTSALGQIDQVTQSQSAAAEQGAATAEQLSAQAIQLKQILGKFQLSKNRTGSVESIVEKAGIASVEANKISSPAVTKTIVEEERRDEDVQIVLDDDNFGEF